MTGKSALRWQLIIEFKSLFLPAVYLNALGRVFLWLNTRYYELWPPDFSIITITISQDFSGQRVFRNRQLNFSSSNNHQGCKAGQADRHVKNWNATFTVDFYASITAPPSDRRQASTWQVADQITVAGPAVFPRGRMEQQNSGEQFRKACCCLRHPCILHEGRPEVFRLGWYYVKWKKKIRQRSVYFSVYI